jgi:hypothetical protein
MNAVPSTARRRDLLLAVTASAWVAILFAAFRPGLMSVDSVLQYEQGMTGVYNNWHPPFVSLLHGIAGRLTGSPWPLFLAQLVLLGGGMALLARAAPPSRTAAAFALLVVFLLVPPIWSLAVTLWKDVLMAIALLWAVVALRARKPWSAFACCVVAVLCRHNAIFAALPLVLYGAALATPRTAVRAAIALGAIVGLGAAPGVVDRLLHAEDRFITGSLLVFDEVAVYTAHPETFAGSPFATQYTASDMARVYSPASNVPIFHGGPEARRIPESVLPPRRVEIEREWLRVVRAHPGAYLRHRILHFFSVTSIDAPICYPFHVGISGNRRGLQLDESRALYKALRRIQDATGSTPLFRGWPWLAVLGAIAVFTGLASRGRSLAFWTALSGLAYAAGYLAVGVVCDFRYLYWSLVSVFAACLVWLSDAPSREC